MPAVVPVLWRSCCAVLSRGTCTSLESHKLRHNCPYFRFGNHHICISGITVHRGTWTLTLFDRPFSKIIHTVLGIFSMHPAFTSGKRRYRTAPILSHRWKAWHQKHGAASRNFVKYLAVKKKRQGTKPFTLFGRHLGERLTAAKRGFWITGTQVAWEWEVCNKLELWLLWMWMIGITCDDGVDGGVCCLL